MFAAPKLPERSDEDEGKNTRKRERFSSEELTSVACEIKSAPKKPKREITFSTPIKLAERYSVETFKCDMADITATDIASEIIKSDTWHCLIKEIVDGACRSAEFVAERIANLEREKLLEALLDTSGEGN